MSDENQAELNYTNAKRPNKHLRLIFAFLFLIIIGFVLLRIFIYKTPQEQLAAIEATLAIPDSENAALLYLQLFEDYNESVFESVLLTPEIEVITRTTAWSSQDYPEIVEHLRGYHGLIEQLSTISKYEKCVFSIINPHPILSSMRAAIFTLMRIANNDLAEGRVNQALEKYICCIRTARHFSKQSTSIDFLNGIAMEAIGLNRIRYFIMYDDVTDVQLKTIETILPYPTINEYYKAMLHVEELIKRMNSKNASLAYRITESLAYRGKDPALERLSEIYLRFSADRQGTQILVALMLCKNKTGEWPEKLDEIKPYLSSEDILIDPQNKGSFVYKLTGDSFILYSKGPNNIDENGQIKAPADDWLIWPDQTSQTQTQNTAIDLNQ